MDQTKNGIDYDWWLAGPNGASFELFPVREKHTIEDVKQAKRELKNDQDVVGPIQVTWKEQ